MTQLQSLFDWAGSIGSWLSQRLSIGAPPETWVVLLGVVAVLVAVFVYPVWQATRNAVTIVHEMGHVVVARLCGRTVSGIKLHTDTSGVAVTRGRPHGLGMLLTALAGYPAPGVVGVALVGCAVTGHAGAALLALVLLLALALLLVRNLWGLLMVAGSLMGSGIVLWHGDPQEMTALVLILGIFLAVGSLRASWGLCVAHLRGALEQSDAISAAKASRVLPAGLWLGYFLVVTLICVVFVAWMSVSLVLLDLS